MENINICCICYIEIINNVILNCKHNFCLNCIIKINKFKNDEFIKCPICRNETIIYNENENEKENEKENENENENIKLDIEHLNLSYIENNKKFIINYNDKSFFLIENVIEKLIIIFKNNDDIKKAIKKIIKKLIMLIMFNYNLNELLNDDRLNKIKYNDFTFNIKNFKVKIHIAATINYKLKLIIKNISQMISRDVTKYKDEKLNIRYDENKKNNFFWILSYEEKIKIPLEIIKKDKMRFTNKLSLEIIEEIKNIINKNCKYEEELNEIIKNNLIDKQIFIYSNKEKIRYFKISEELGEYKINLYEIK